MMKCNYCGAENYDGASSCCSCGRTILTLHRNAPRSGPRLRGSLAPSAPVSGASEPLYEPDEPVYAPIAPAARPLPEPYYPEYAEPALVYDEHTSEHEHRLLVGSVAALLVILCGLIAFWIIQANRPVNLSGTVLEAGSGQALSGATIEIIDVNSGEVKRRAKTDSRGEYSVRAPAGAVTVTFSRDGYAAQSMELSGLEKGESYDLGTCRLMSADDVADEEAPAAPVVVTPQPTPQPTPTPTPAPQTVIIPVPQPVPQHPDPKSDPDKETASGPAWKSAYRSFVLNGGYRSHGERYYSDEAVRFALRDMNDDGVPELLTTNGSTAYVTRGAYVFTFSGGNVVCLGKISAPAGRIHIAPNTGYPGLFTFVAVDDGCFIGSYYTVLGGTLHEEVICNSTSEDTEDGESEHVYSCVTDESDLYDACWVAFPGEDPGEDSSVNALPWSTDSQIRSMGWDAFTAGF